MISGDYSAMLGLDSRSIQVRLAALGLTEDDRQHLYPAVPTDATIANFLEVLYARMQQHDDLSALLSHPAQVERLKEQQRAYLRELFTASLDRMYVERRLAIGLAHHRVRLSPKWYLATYAHFICDLLGAVLAGAATPSTAALRVQTLIRTVFFDASLAIDAYGHAEERQRQGKAVAAQPPAPASPVASHDHEPHAPSTRHEARARIRLTAEGLMDMRRYVGITEDVLDVVRSLAPIIERHLPAMLADFYDTLEQLPETAVLFETGHRQRLMQQVTSYWLEMGRGTFDRTYAASRMRIGVIHEKLGLSVAWYLSGLARQMTSLVRALLDEAPDPLVAVDAFVRAVFFDLAFIIDAYMEARADALLRTEGYANQLVATLPSAVAVVDRHNRLIAANQTMAALCGGDPAVLYLMPAAKALPLREATAVVDTVRRSGSPQHTVLTRLGMRHFRVTGMSLGEGALPSHGIAAIAVVIDDVTDVLTLAAELSQETDRSDQLADATGTVLWEIDIESWAVVAVNRAVARVTGYRDVYFLGRPHAWIDAVLQTDRPRFIAVASSIEYGQHAEIDYRMRAADGRDVWLRSRLVLAESNPKRLVGVTVDVTAEYRADSLRLDATAQIAGGVAHVVNNALTVILGNIELQAIEHGGLDHTPLLQHAVGAIEKAQAMAVRLMAFARRQPLKSARLSWTEVVRAEEQTLRELVGPRIVLTTDLDDDLWRCQSDRDMLVTALQALIANARTAISDTGVITLATRNVPAGEFVSEGGGLFVDCVELQVRDNGCGMTAEVKARAFEPFFTTRSLAEASGLGLSLVHGFAAQSGGMVGLESTPGSGTLVRLRLPRADADD